MSWKRFLPEILTNYRQAIDLEGDEAIEKDNQGCQKCEKKNNNSDKAMEVVKNILLVPLEHATVGDLCAKS